MTDLLKPVLFLAAVSLPASLAFAQTGPAATTVPGNSTITVEGKKEKKVCRNYPAPTGSRFGARKVCKSAEEWRVDEARLQRSIDQQDMNRKANQAQDWNDKNQAGFGQPLPR